MITRVDHLDRVVDRGRCSVGRVNRVPGRHDRSSRHGANGFLDTTEIGSWLGAESLEGTG